MSVTYGFYNSMNHDRKYSSIDMSSMFDGLINDGIYKSVGDHFAVTQHADGANMSVDVGSGRAWFNHTWTLNDSTLTLDIPSSDLVLNRIDAVILEVNAGVNARKNSIKILKGTPAENPTNPTLTNNADIHQYALAYIYVGAAVNEITNDDITDVIGTAETPYVLGIVDVSSTIVNAVYPIGSIYMTVNAVNPGTIFAGTTWEEWGSGRVPIGVDKSNNSFKNPDYAGGTNIRTITPSGSISGGAVQSHTLTTSEMPKHRHTYWGSNNVATMAVSALYTSHVQLSSSGAVGNTVASTSDNSIKYVDGTEFSGQNSGHTHGFTQPTFKGTEMSISVTPAYITCYMWKRTA